MTYLIDVLVTFMSPFETYSRRLLAGAAGLSDGGGGVQHSTDPSEDGVGGQRVLPLHRHLHGCTLTVVAYKWLSSGLGLDLGLGLT